MILDRGTFQDRKPAIAIALFPPLFLILSQWLRAANVELYVELFTEDAPPEYAQAIMFFAGGLIALSMSRTFLGQGDRLFSALHLLLGVGLLFIAMEEISWGQRILLIETPESFQQTNLSNQINLHNSIWFQNPDYSATWFSYLQRYMWGYLAFSWVLVPARLGSHLGERIHSLVPSWYLMPYFAPLLWIPNCGACGELAGPPIWATEEVGEVLLALGLLLFVVLGRRRLLLASGGASPVEESDYGLPPSTRTAQTDAGRSSQQ